MSAHAGQRASRRVPVSIPAGYVQPGKRQGVCKIVELSAGGCIVDMIKLDQRGPEVFLHFRVGREKKEVQLRARVVRLREGLGMALEFISITPENREFLRQQVEEAADKPKRAR